MSECREPLTERACELNAPARFWPELERFIADEGMGIAEETLGLMPPSVCGCGVVSFLLLLLLLWVATACLAVLVLVLTSR